LDRHGAALLDRHSHLRIGKTKFYHLYHSGELHGTRLGDGETDIRIYASSVLEMMERYSNRKVPNAAGTPLARPDEPVAKPANPSPQRRGRGRPRKTVRLSDMIRYQPPRKR
jgi:hypothetical protein